MKHNEIEDIDNEKVIKEIQKKREQKKCCDCVWADVSSGAMIICGRMCNNKERFIFKYRSSNEEISFLPDCPGPKDPSRRVQDQS